MWGDWEYLKCITMKFVIPKMICISISKILRPAFKIRISIINNQFVRVRYQKMSLNVVIIAFWHTNNVMTDTLFFT